MKAGKILIGCSGWSYAHWRGLFYPEELPRSRWFEHYTANFRTVEINSTFYHLPQRKTCEKWVNNSPEEFVYTIKMWRAITHYSRLKGTQEQLTTFMSRIEPMLEKTTCILVQLPPGLHKDMKLLQSFIKLLPESPLFAFEFRHKSWYTDEVYKLLEKVGVAFVVHDYQAKPSPRIVLGNSLYVRFHGPKGNYTGGYKNETLKDWATWIVKNSARGVDCLAYFNNDFEANAVFNARTLIRMVEQLKRKGAKACR